jgi:hypothetical protein
VLSLSVETLWEDIMTKHIADHRTPSDISRRKHFWALDKFGEDSPHPAVKILTQRPQDRTDGPRLQHFLRIARGQTA